MERSKWCFFGIDSATKDRRMIGYEGDRWCCYFWRSGWAHISIGFHIAFEMPNIEIHVPFGFFRVGAIVPFFGKQSKIFQAVKDDE